MIQPNSYTSYPFPTVYLESFIYQSRRYVKTHTKCLINDYGKYGFLPPLGRGAYLKISPKEYKIAKQGYELEKQKYENSINGNLNLEAKTQLTFSF